MHQRPIPPNKQEHPELWYSRGIDSLYIFYLDGHYEFDLYPLPEWQMIWDKYRRNEAVEHIERWDFLGEL